MAWRGFGAARRGVARRGMARHGMAVRCVAVRKKSVWLEQMDSRSAPNKLEAKLTIRFGLLYRDTRTRMRAYM